MGVSPGTGAGIGIACGLVLLFIAGPVAYRHRKKKHLQAQHGLSQDVEVAEDKAQLADTQVSRSSTWRTSGISAPGPDMPEMGTQHSNRGLGIVDEPLAGRPLSEAAGSEIAEVEGSEIAEVDASDQQSPAELGVGKQSPNRAELRADPLTPPSNPLPPEAVLRPITEYPAQLLRKKSSDGPQINSPSTQSGLPDVSTLPGPILPPPTH